MPNPLRPTIATVMQWFRAGTANVADAPDDPVAPRAPENLADQLADYTSLLARYTAHNADLHAVFKEWWGWFNKNASAIPQDAKTKVWQATKVAATGLARNGQYEDAETLIAFAFKHWPDDYDALEIMAVAAQDAKDWDHAVQYWQLYAATANPITTKSRTHVAKNPIERLRKTKYALGKLQTARLHQALAAPQHPSRGFDEMVYRIVEALPDHHQIADRPLAIDVIRAFVLRAVPRKKAMRPDPDAQRKIVLCLDNVQPDDLPDILGTCHVLHDDNAMIYIALMNEHRMVTAAGLDTTAGQLAVKQQILDALPEGRITIQHLSKTGLDALLGGCETICDVHPDLVICARGASASAHDINPLRHILYTDFPTVVLQFTAQTQTDDRIDAVINVTSDTILQDLTQAQDIGLKRLRAV